MSELHCPARILVARHGEADYETDLLVDHGGSLSREGREQAGALAASLATERVAAIWSSSLSRAVQTAEIVAARLGCDVTVREGLRELGVGVHAGSPVDPDPLRPTFDRWLEGDLDARIEGGESGAEVVARVSGVLAEIADLHRGETVLVVSHGGAICLSISELAVNLDPRFPLDRPLPNCGVVELEADASGWRALSWVGERVGDHAEI